ncbi:biogenesis of lysosome-related organelles complex 1 subunit 6-like [Asterias amurensis]|uniref:biogenesis of lysosome-related organelles complex 1 subunit 6-like n=1 Tax=Asterias amurensis TaxID=7602 RepID=UPI003AB291F2
MEEDHPTSESAETEPKEPATELQSAVVASQEDKTNNEDGRVDKATQDDETGAEEMSAGKPNSGSVQRDQGQTAPSLPERDVLPVNESVIEKLTVAFLQTFLPQAEHSNAELDELMRNQRVLIETLQQENSKFQENDMMSELSELMVEAKKYYIKLVHLRKEMISLHEKSTKLKKRAIKLQHHKMKQNLQREQQRERELEQEKHLIAKPAKKSP